MARLRSFSAASWASPVAPSAVPSAPSMAGSWRLLRVHEAADDDTGHEAGRLLPTANGPKASGSVLHGGEELVGGGRGDEVQRDADLLPLVLDGDLVLGRLAQDGDVELEAVRVARVGQQLLGLVRVVAELLVQRRVEARRALGEELRRRPGRRGAGPSRWPRGRWRSRERAARPCSRRPGWSAPVLSRTGKPTIVPPDLTTLCLDSTRSTVVASSAPPTSA